MLKVCNIQSKFDNIKNGKNGQNLKKVQVNFLDTVRLSKLKSIFVNYSKFAIAQQTNYTKATFGE